jgi:ATP-dependent Lhr-like helicase
LLFTNTRSQAEMWFQALLTARPDWLGEIALHHGSIDRSLRIEIENRLRAGRLRGVVCTSSLDLGVDFSPVEQVIQIGSPKGVARLLQRAGRSGHQPGAVSRVIGVPTHALELAEFAAARDAVGRGIVESREPLDRPLDVLVQHLVTIALGDGFVPRSMLDEVRRSHAFSALTDEEWSWAMEFVTRGGPTLTAYPQYAKVAEQDGCCTVESRRTGQMHRMSIGTITSDGAISVRFVGGRTLGTVEESFVSRLTPGDRFVFAGRVVELVRVRDMTAHVRKATSIKGAVPRWMGGRSPLSTQLADSIRMLLDDARGGTYRSAEMQIIKPLLDLQAAWSRIPAINELLIELIRYRDGHHAFAFTFAGRLVNEGLSALVAYRITRRAPGTLSVTANDYGFEVLSVEPLELDADAWRSLLTPANLVDDLLACLNSTELARRQFREIARVAGLVFPGYPGQGKTTRQLQASSDLFYDVFSQFDPQNLLLDQSRREVLSRELEVVRMRHTLERIANEQITVVRPERFTPLSFPLWVERIRSQQVSSERWMDRVQRMVVQLERAADREGTTPRRVERVTR